MNAIWTAYSAKTITAKEALDKLGKELLRKGITKKEQGAALATIDRILDAEVPMTERDLDAEETYTARQRAGNDE